MLWKKTDLFSLSYPILLKMHFNLTLNCDCNYKVSGRCIYFSKASKSLSKNKVHFSLQATWLSHGQLWAIFEQLVSLIQCETFSSFLIWRPLWVSKWGWVPKATQVLSCVCTGNPPILEAWHVVLPLQNIAVKLVCVACISNIITQFHSIYFLNCYKIKINLLINCWFKGYLCYKMITSQYVSSEARIKNFLIL